ncbi:Cell division protein ftsB homolog [Xenorhabdus poinarii G6]|uniref:Cell division protein FtsB n=1 Tax=Xenorhabdus poinarii G6 TaxID=1354304 RepID=A0A068R569_9GAMM|nr:cell division protein FtsB [Xenorhabdus poinarii]CDG22422.1 Cell division protein ftsB homolog [Xenorhabdus poinarii G6]
MGKLTLLLLVILGWLQYTLWLGKNGIYDYMRVQADVEKQAVNTLKIKARNEQLTAEVKDLKNLQGNMEAIEERARNELGMIKPDETFYRIVPDASKHHSK